ncbi:cramped protein [Anaeramoeba ignava]|uniref:Cramped protein n=1 Tax=Anaeramoeba ignava TaxID=1746090 RepID=A0A9Q0LW26_ANAIG|nr:cramped protein [Anaeramoeba ignava]
MPKSKLKSKSKSNKSNKSKSSESTEKQFVIRLVPKEQEQANILIESGHIPYLQLSMKSTKPLRSVLEHLNRKWKEAFVKSPKYDSYVILFPVSAPKDRAGWCLQNSDGVLVRDLAEDNPIQGYLSLEYFWKIEQKEEKNTNENLKENTIENPKGKPIENINQNSISNFFANSFNNIDIPENEKKYNKNIKRGKKAKAKKGEKNIKQARRKRKKKSKIRNEKPSQNKIQEKKFMEQFSRAEEQEKSSKKARMLKGKNKISNKMKNKLSAKKNRQKSKQENLFPNNDSNLGNFANNFSNTKMDSILQLDSTPIFKPRIAAEYKLIRIT